MGGAGFPPVGPQGPPVGGRDVPEFVPGSILKNREILYRLMISQLFYDGHQQVAVQLSNIIQPDPSCPPSEKLFHIVSLGLEKDTDVKSNRVEPLGPGLDLEYETDMPSNAPEPAFYETAYVTSHKGNCRAGAFSIDGTLCATGSVDASIKILDVERMLAKSNVEHMTNSNNEQGGHPVIRTLYDHIEEVTCLDFHPKEPILASGSRDLTVKLFDFSKTSAKKAVKTITDSEPITTIAFHPTGEYILVGCEQPILRLYDLNTSQCFVGSVPTHHHQSDITCAKWSPDGKMYVTSSVDGAIKIWDGISSQVIATFANAHERAEVCSVQFTRNGKYVLSSGRDSSCKLWELSTTRCLIAYTGAGATGKQEHRAQAVMNHTEDYVMFPDEATTSLCCWDARNATRKQLLSLGHNGVVRHIVHSPVSPAFLTCSDDFRARFWYKRPLVQ